MKKYLLLLLGITIISCGAIPQVSGPPPINKLVETNLNKDDNYVRANEWMVEAFNNAESVIQFSDKENGIVKGKYILKPAYISTSPYVASTPSKSAIITIKVKDNAAKITVDISNETFHARTDKIYLTYTIFDAKKAIDALLVSFQHRMIEEEDKF